MNFHGKAVLVYLEEDNIARAYFRILPLMTQEGPVGDTKAAYPDNGYLRIVPDKNEQHTFKERMRSMCGLCIMDLRYLPVEANKIRTNKNYSPARGENNQYIIYSDAVRALPEDLLYQVVAEGGIATADTPLVYIRNGANIQGPFRREDGQPVGDPVQLPPDSAEIHAVTVNGQELLFYWPKTEEAPAATAAEENQPEKAPAAEKKEEAPAAAPQPNAYDQIQSMNVAPAPGANRLRDTSPAAPFSFPPADTSKPLNGTKLYQAPQRQESFHRAHNPLMEAVENQRYAARYEAPGATLPQNAELKEVHNPADALKRALQSMWQCQETQNQAVDVVLTQPGMRSLLAKAVSREANDLTVAAMHSQLQELEAERLMTLMQLDDAKKNLAAAREEALGKLTGAEQKKLDGLRAAQQEAQTALDSLSKTLASLEEKRGSLIGEIQQMEGALDQPAHAVCAAVGEDVPKAELISRTLQCLLAAGFEADEDDALALLTAYALTPDAMQFCSFRAEDAETAADAFAAALGVKAEDQGFSRNLAVLPGGSAPLLIKDLNRIEGPLVTGIYAAGAEDLNSEYFTPVTPCIPVTPDVDRLPGKMPVFPPVSKSCILRELTSETALSDDTKAVILALRKAMAENGHPLPLIALDPMCRFISATQSAMKNGVADAIDRAVCLYTVPYLRGCGEEIESVKPLLSAMPRTLKALNP